jgi:hypothetical protein
MFVTAYTNIEKTRQIKPVQKNSVNFCAQTKCDIIEPFISKSLEKLGDFSTENYKKLSRAEKIKLRKEYQKLSTTSDFYENCEDIHDKVSDCIKKVFDRKYRENNYVVIMIGRSLSSIGKVLGYKTGENNVKNIPMSNAFFYTKDAFNERLKRLGHIDKLNEYLNSIGLNKEIVEKSKKKYIVMDYCSSGASLKGGTHILQREDVLGNSDKISSCDVMECLPSKDDRIRLEGYLYSGLFKKYAFVKSSTYFDNIMKNTVNPQEEELKTKLVWFKLLDNQMQKEPNRTDKGHSIMTFFKNLF